METLRKKRPRMLFAGCLSALGLTWAATPAKATQYLEFLNGAECRPVLGLSQEVAYYLRAFGGSVDCQLRMTTDLPLNKLTRVSYDLIANTPGTVLHLCIYDFFNIVSCTHKTHSVSGRTSDHIETPPLPPFPRGAYLRMDFPTSSNTDVLRLIVEWNK